MVPAARYAFVAVVWVFLAAVVVQTFVAGSALFGADRSFETHRTLGYILHLTPILIVILAFVGRVGSETLYWTGALVVTTFVQPLLPMLRADFPWAAAMHPVLALVIFWLALVVGLRGWRLAREPAAASA